MGVVGEGPGGGGGGRRWGEVSVDDTSTDGPEFAATSKAVFHKSTLLDISQVHTARFISPSNDQLMYHPRFGIGEFSEQFGMGDFSEQFVCTGCEAAYKVCNTPFLCCPFRHARSNIVM